MPMRADRLLALLLVRQAAAQAGTECTAASAADALAPQSTPQRTHTDAQLEEDLAFFRQAKPLPSEQSAMSQKKSARTALKD